MHAQAKPGDLAGPDINAGSPDHTRPAVLPAPQHCLMWLALWMCRPLSWLPYRLLITLGKGFGLSCYLLLRTRRRRASRNLQLCLPENSAPEHARLLRENFIAYGIGAVERLMGWWWPRKRLLRVINAVEGLPHLQRAADEGRGVILLSLHNTSMEIGAALIRSLHAVDGVYLPDDNPVYDRHQLRARSRRDRAGEMVPAGNVRDVIRRLRAGRAIWYAADRHYPGKPYVMAPLFGVPAATITATSKYARLTGAHVMPYEIWRDPAGGYRLRIDAPLENFPSDDPLADCTRINAWIECAVRRHPAQYRWVHKRFKMPAPASSLQRPPQREAPAVRRSPSNPRAENRLPRPRKGPLARPIF